MKILYQIPDLNTVYAARFIYEGYKAAFIELGHQFKPLVAGNNFSQAFKNFNPDIFIFSLNRYHLKFIDLKQLNKFRKNGLVCFVQLPPWKKVTDQFGGNGLKHDKELVTLIKNEFTDDIFFTWLQEDDPQMDGFSKETGCRFETILLAANTNQYYFQSDEKYVSQISYVGNCLPDKKQFFTEHLLPLKKKYDLKIYGSDWDYKDKILGYVQKFGQYYNIKHLKNVRSIKLPIEDEKKVYSSSIVSLNIHEAHQRKFGSDFNERTFKIIASGGFEVCDHVSVIRKYFNENELVMAKDTNDWFDKIDYYIKNPDKRIPIIKAGKNKILKEHTYINRAKQIIEIFNEH